MGGNKAKRVPFARLAAHRAACGRQAAVNYCRGFEVLDSKELLARTLAGYCREAGVPFESLMPTTLPFSAATQAPKRRAAEKAAVMAAVDAAAAAGCQLQSQEVGQQSQQGRRRAIWILKDAALNQGQACTLLEEPAEIAAFLDAAAAPLVVQRYIDNPLLYTGSRKV